MTSPQESRSILVDPATLPYRLFLCNEDRESLAGTAALDYIRHGEAQGFHKRSSVRSRKLWYGLGDRQPAHLLHNRRVDKTSRTFLNADRVLIGDTLYELVCKDEDAIGLCAAMNSSLFQLCMNTLGRSNFGAGVLEAEVYEIEAMVALADHLPSIDEGIFRSTQWDVMDPSAERREIDGVVFDALGLTEGERAGVYEAVLDLVGKRLAKAKSLRR